jgi:hypothetical protein
VPRALWWSRFGAYYAVGWGVPGRVRLPFDSSLKLVVSNVKVNSPCNALKVVEIGAVYRPLRAIVQTKSWPGEGQKNRLFDRLDFRHKSPDSSECQYKSRA